MQKYNIIHPGPKGESVIWGPMDDNALQNDGGRERANTGCPPFTHCGKFDEYALRDIKKGEEILCDYGNFFSLNFLEFDKWKEFGLWSYSYSGTVLSK